MLAKDRYIRTMDRMTHELKNPIVSIQGCVQYIERAFEKKRIDRKEFLGYDFIADIQSWSDLMRRVLQNAEYLHPTLEAPDRKKLLLVPDVIAPVVRQMQPLLEARGFEPRNISYENLHRYPPPPLWLDRIQFQQVVFNLLGNSIKYSHSKPEAFEVNLVGRHDGDFYSLVFQDSGIGIDKDETRIFEEGYRCPEALEMHVGGNGIGLWVVKRIIEGHGGYIELTHNRSPTEFTVSIPVARGRAD